MRINIRTIAFGLIVALVVVTGLMAACGGPASTEPAEPAQEEQPTAVPEELKEEEPATPPPSGDGVVLLEERCTVCHGLERATQAQKSREEWEQTVTRMIGHGAELTEDEQVTLVEHLAATYGP